MPGSVSRFFYSRAGKTLVKPIARVMVYVYIYVYPLFPSIVVQALLQQYLFFLLEEGMRALSLSETPGEASNNYYDVNVLWLARDCPVITTHTISYESPETNRASIYI